MPRPVSDTIADGLPLWDTYEAVFFLVTGVFLGLVLGFLFPSAWRSFRRSFRQIDKYGVYRGSLAGDARFSAKNPLIAFEDDHEPELQPTQFDLASVFVAARYAVQENSFREAVALYLQILGSEKVSRTQTNKAMFELTQVYALSGLSEKAIETGLELLHRKPAQPEIFKFLLSACHANPDHKLLMDVLETYSGPKSGELAREVTHFISSAARHVLLRGSQREAASLAKQAVRWSPSTLEAKLILIEATSILSQPDPTRPLDQDVLGFFVDLAELLRLGRSHSNRAPFFAFSLLGAWADFFDRNDAEVEQVLTRLKIELLNQIDFGTYANDEVFRRDVALFFDVMTLLRKNMAGETRWLAALAQLLAVQLKTVRRETFFFCQGCSAMQRHFQWKCGSCGRWDSLAPWGSGPELPADGRLASQI
ncbi:MAG: tetratricopeptide repeat protein [Silvanigrellaceae bacterium]